MLQTACSRNNQRCTFTSQMSHIYKGEKSQSNCITVNRVLLLLLFLGKENKRVKNKVFLSSTDSREGKCKVINSKVQR